jgi:hypothetical protein
MIYTNRNGLPKHLEEAIMKNTYDISKNDPNIISVTTLISPPRIRQLMLRHWDFLEEDVSDRLWALLGSSVHSVMERIGGDNRLIEERIAEDVMGIKVSGKSDLYDGADCSINDYKVTSTYAVKMDKDEWVAQLNTYAWLFRKTGFVVNKANINAILRDWQRSKVGKWKDYPTQPFKTIPIELWDFQKQTDYVIDRVAEHLNAVNLADDDLPLCTEKERWDDKRCDGYCTCNKFCNYYLNKKNPKPNIGIQKIVDEATK